MRNAGERFIDFLCGGNAHDREVNLQDAGSCLETGQYTFIERVGWVHDDPHYRSFGHNLMQHLDLFGRHHQFGHADAGEVAARSVETGDKAGGDGIGTRDEYNRNGCGRRLGSEHGRKAKGRNRGHVALNQVGGEPWQPIVLPFGIAVFYRDVLTLDIAHGGEPVAERCEIGGEFVSRSTVEEADHRHRLLLRAKGAGRYHRAGEEENQFAPPHSITSSARARTDCGIVSPSAFAVLRLMTISNFVVCSTGRSSGLAPLRIRPV